MRKTTLKGLRAMINTGMAVRLKNTEDVPQNFTKIAISTGIHGMNGGLIRNNESGQFMAIVGRSDVLFFVF